MCVCTMILCKLDALGPILDLTPLIVRAQQADGVGLWMSAWSLNMSGMHIADINRLLAAF